MIVKLDEIESPEDLQSLVLKDIYIEDRFISKDHTDPSSTFRYEGYSIEDLEGKLLGEITDFLEISHQDFIVISSGENTFQWPFHESLISKVDDSNKIISYNFPTGYQEFI